MKTSDPVASLGWSAASQSLNETNQCRRGASWQWQVLALILLTAAAGILIRIIGGFQPWIVRRGEVLIALGGIACWRWSWFVLQNFRAVIYRYWTFPRMRREAERSILQSGPISELTILATTYHERPWITSAVFESLFRELSAVAGLDHRPKVIVVTGCDEDDQNIKHVFAECRERLAPSSPSLWPPDVWRLRPPSPLPRGRSMPVAQ